MAFPASKGVLADHVSDACRLMMTMKREADARSAEMAAGNTSATRVLNLESDTRTARDKLQAFAAIEGIGQAAQDELAEPGLDVGVEFQAVVDALDNVVTWIRTNFPTANQSGTSYLAARSWGPDGPVQRQFSPTDTAGLRTALDALSATIA